MWEATMFELQVLPLDGAAASPGRFIVYRPRAGLAFVGNRALAALAQAASSGGQAPPNRHGEALAFLDRIGFLVPDPPLPAEPEAEFRPRSAVLLLTNKCSLRCVYCYAS